MLNSELDNTGMEIPVSEIPPGPSGIKTEPKEDCEDLLSAFLMDPPPVKIENNEISYEYGTLSKDYTVDVKKLKTEHSEDNKEWLNNPLIKNEKNNELAVSEDRDDDFTEDSNIKSEEMHIKEDDGINEPGISSSSYDQDTQEVRRTTKKTTPVFQCPDSHFNTTTKRDITRHSARHNRKQEPKDKFACSKCNFKGTRKGILNAHLLRHLSSEQATEYNCDICEFATLFKSHMERHLRKHTKEVFQCDQCTFTTKYKRCLTSHSLVRHENPENLTKYSCPECDYTTIEKRRLKDHSLIHGKPNDVLKCYHCSYESLRKQSLKRHLQRHLKMPGTTSLFEEHLRLNCDSQNAENNQASAISLTESVDNYKFRCQNCDYKTNWSSSFTIHLKQHETPKKKRQTKSW